MSSSIDRERAVTAGLSQKPFMFETSFDEANGELLLDGGGREPPEPQYGEAELEQARQDAFEAGRRAALEEETLKAEQRLAAAEEKVAGALGGLLEGRQALEQQLTREASEATLLMLRKLFPRLSETESLAEVEALIDGCLERVRQEPRIVVRVAPAQVEKITARASERANAYFLLAELFERRDGPEDRVAARAYSWARWRGLRVWNASARSHCRSRISARVMAGESMYSPYSS